MEHYWIDLALGTGAFTLMVALLSLGILMARRLLVSQGDVQIILNDQEDKAITVASGSKLLQTLSDQGVFLASACGGGGTCAQCRCQVDAGGGSILPVEMGHFNLRERQENWRLSCQVAVKQDMRIRVPEEALDARSWTCTVRSNHNVATFIKELVLELPAGENCDFRAGGYVQLVAPPYQLPYKEMQIETEYHSDWDHFNIWRYLAQSDEEVVRAYSMANYPEEKQILKFNIRVASPPPGGPEGIPPGLMSSFVFGLKPGDEVKVLGPFGEFFAKESDKEMVFIGGGAGMAPMRAHIFDQLKRLKSKRKISFWYGGRSLKEMFYIDEFDQLAAENANFTWHTALSDPLPEDKWTGLTGFIHQVLLDEYLGKHEAPEDCEYYVCGPPMMLSAVRQMLDDLGVDKEDVLFDDFG